MMPYAPYGFRSRLGQEQPSQQPAQAPAAPPSPPPSPPPATAPVSAPPAAAKVERRPNIPEVLLTTALAGGLTWIGIRQGLRDEGWKSITGWALGVTTGLLGLGYLFVESGIIKPVIPTFRVEI
jgi:hypothetical protein